MSNVASNDQQAVVSSAYNAGRRGSIWTHSIETSHPVPPCYRTEVAQESDGAADLLISEPTSPVQTPAGTSRSRLPRPPAVAVARAMAAQTARVAALIASATAHQEYFAGPIGVDRNIRRRLSFPDPDVDSSDWSIEASDAARGSDIFCSRECAVGHARATVAALALHEPATSAASDECPVCYEVKVLAHLTCQHSVCLGCLERMADAAMVNCPLCRAAYVRGCDSSPAVVASSEERSHSGIQRQVGTLRPVWCCHRRDRVRDGVSQSRVPNSPRRRRRISSTDRSTSAEAALQPPLRRPRVDRAMLEWLRSCEQTMGSQYRCL